MNSIYLRSWTMLGSAAFFSLLLIIAIYAHAPDWAIWLNACAVASNWYSSGRILRSVRWWDMMDWKFEAQEAELRHRLRLHGERYKGMMGRGER